MPYEIKGNCVHKKGEEEPIKCHKTHEEAEAHMKALYAAELDAMKAGARNSKKDAERLQMIHDYAMENGAVCQGMNSEHEEEYKAQSIKAADLDGIYTTYNTPPLAIKMAGEMMLDVCYMPYQGQRGGKDADGQYFSPRTNEHADKFPHPLVLYYHGYERQGVQQLMPEEIGTSTGTKWIDKAGRWMRVKLDAGKEKALRVWRSAQKGNARASSDSIASSCRSNWRRTATGQLPEY